MKFFKSKEDDNGIFLTQSHECIVPWGIAKDGELWKCKLCNGVWESKRHPSILGLGGKWNRRPDLDNVPVVDLNDPGPIRSGVEGFPPPGRDNWIYDKF